MRSRFQQGFSLVELMLAVSIGAIIVLGATTVFMSTLRSFNVQNGLSETNDTGRYAMQYLARHIRMAGYRDSEWGRGALPNAVDFTDGATSDTVTVTYESRFGCNTVAAPAVTAIDNVFDVVDGVLRCNGRTIMDGVEELQVFLGEDTDGDGVANRYVDPGTPDLNMDNVVTVSLNLLVNSAAGGLATNAQPIVFDFWNTDVAADGRLRREYTLTVGLRNTE